MDKLIYLDNNSTTQIDPLVLEEMLPYLTTAFGNASSSHFLGQKSKTAVNWSRGQLAELLVCNENEIYFTSGATESINLCFKGVVETSNVKSPHIITVKTEHPAVLDTCRWLETKGVTVTYLPVSSDGLINLDELVAAIKPETILISVMYVNNETGIIQPIKKISEIAHERNILFMSDATQAVGKLLFSVYELGIDIVCFSGHKFYGPKGVGGVFIRSKRPFKPRVSALLHGGGHERSIRSGTLNVPGIVGIGKAAELSKQLVPKENKAIFKFRNQIETSLLEIPNSAVNGNLENRIYSTTNIRIQGIDADALIAAIPNIAISNGSACSSESIDPSHVLVAMGLSTEEAFSSIRVSLGRFNTDDEVNESVAIIQKAVVKLRKFSTSV